VVAVSPKGSRRGPDAPPPSAAEPGVFSHQLRAGDVVIDEHGIAWELLGRPTKVVGSHDYVTTIRRVDRPVDTKEGRWPAHERVKVKRA
jgi:hypothetical protein